MATCAQCGDTFTAARSTATFCSPGCRQKAYRTRNNPAVTPTVTTSSVTPAVTATVDALDWDTIPGNQREKLQKARETIRKELEKEFRARFRADAVQYRAECDANVANYKAKLDDDFAARDAARHEQNQRINTIRDDERRRYQQGIEVQRAKGLIPPSDYALIRSCLHPDSRNSTTGDKLAAAFRVFNDPRIKVLLVKEM